MSPIPRPQEDDSLARQHPHLASFSFCVLCPDDLQAGHATGDQESHAEQLRGQNNHVPNATTTI